MKSSYFKSKLFLKYISSYLFILLIPLILMTLFIYKSAITNLREQIEQSHLDQLTHTKENVDGRMKELHDIASRISYDHRLTSYWVHHPYYSSEAIKALDQYHATSSIIEEIFLYFHEDDKIYSSKGMNSFDVFAETFRFQNKDKETIFNDLNSVKSPLLYPSDQINHNYMKRSMLTYLVPITPGSTNPHGTVMYFIKESAVTGLMDSILGDYEGQTLILDSQGKLLASNSQGEILSGSDMTSLLQLPPGIYDRVINEVPHSIVSVKSENNGWTYITLMPSEQFFSSVLHVRSLLIMLFSIVMVVGAAVSVLLARMQYEPVSMLVEFADSNTRERGTEQSVSRPGNEWERIRTALQDSSSRIDLQEPYARNHFLSLMLKYGGTEHLSPELYKAFDLHFDAEHHFVMLIGWNERQPSRTDMLERHQVIQYLAQIEFPQLSAQGYGVELPQLDQVALMISFNRSGQVEHSRQFRSIVSAVRDCLLELSGTPPVIGVGTCYPSANEWNQSFIEACSALELRSPGAQGNITYFDKLSQPAEQVYWVPSPILMKLSQSIKQGNFDVAAAMVHAAVQILHTPDQSALLKRCISFDILNTILKTAAELGIHAPFQDNMLNPAFSHSLEELEQSLLELASQICKQVESEQQRQEQSLMDQIVDYVDRHYTDHMLSLESVAFEFSVSPSHISRSFKDQTGLNFSHYIWQKRLDEVKHQLITTSDPLKDIIQRVGYLDTPNFIRKFKKGIGCTPGQYRKMHTEARSESI